MKLFVRREDGRKGWRLAAGAGVFIFLIIIMVAVASIYFGVVSQKNLYMLEYVDEISLYSQKYGLDPYLISAMIYCESTFRSDAVSSVGATGLMQIMPSTGRWLAEKIGIKNFTAQMLYRPSVNIEMGCYYMRFLLDRYGENVHNAIAAYHSGQGRVDGWLKDPAISDDGENLHNIPEGETRKYTQRVMKVHEIYKKLYKDSFQQ